jgi:SAM-dependent methyltransferase
MGNICGADSKVETFWESRPAKSRSVEWARVGRQSWTHGSRFPDKRQAVFGLIRTASPLNRNGPPTMPHTATYYWTQYSDVCIGVVDFIQRSEGRIKIRGWALELVEGRMEPAERLVILDGRNSFEIDAREHRELRTNVAERYGLERGTAAGFEIELDAHDVNSEANHMRVLIHCRDGSLFEMHPLERTEGDDFEALRDRIAFSTTLPVPGRGNELPEWWGMGEEPVEQFLGSAGEYVLLMGRFGGLRPEDKFLDVGCGIGRIANGLTQYLAPDTPYVGFDIVSGAVEWATQHISSRHENFRFVHFDLKNEYYNPKGKIEDLAFPVEDRDFDFVFLGSVFTHMYFDDVAEYLVEINQHMKIGATVFATFFLINAESERAVRLGHPEIPFVLGDEVESYTVGQSNLYAVALREDDVRVIYEQCGFELTRVPIYGCWTGTRSCRHYQDILIARKTSEA